MADTQTATFWRRASSFLLDIFILNIFIISQFGAALNKYLNNMTISSAMTQQMKLNSGFYVLIFVISLLVLMYFTFFEYYLGQTIGDMLLGIKTVSVRKKGEEKVGLFNAALRNCYVIPFFPFYVLWIVEPIYLIFYKQRFLEKITFTKTVYVERKYDARSKDYRLEKVN